MKLAACALVVALSAASVCRVTTTAAAPTTRPGTREERSQFPGPTLTEDERNAIRKAIRALPKDELVELVRKGQRVQTEAAVQGLIDRDEFKLLLDLAKEGGGAGDIIVEFMVPKAEADSPAEAKERVDQYLSLLEEQLRSKTPTISSQQAVRSIAQAGRCRMWSLYEKGPAPRAPYGNARALKKLIELLNDDRQVVRNGAVDGLGMIGGYDKETAAKVTAILEAYRRATEKRPEKYLEVRLAAIDGALHQIKMEQEHRDYKEKHG